MELQNDHDILVSLDGKLDNLLNGMNSMNSFTKGLESRIMALEVSRATEIEKAGQLVKDVEKLKNNNTAWAALNSIGIIIGAVIGIKF